MTEEAKQKCPICNKVWDKALAPQQFEMHVMACEKRNAVRVAEANAKPEETELDREKRRAKAIAAVRCKQAPKIIANPTSEPNPLAELERYVFEAKLVEPDAHIYFGEATRRNIDIQKGYSPVTEHGEHLGFGDLVMYEIPMAVYKAEVAKNAAMSNNAIYGHLLDTEKKNQSSQESIIDAAVEKALAARERVSA